MSSKDTEIKAELKGRQVGLVVVAGFLGWALTSADQGALSFGLPGILAYFNISVIEFGVILDIALFTAWVLATWSGTWVEKYGRKRIFTWMFILAAAGSFLSGLAINIVMLTIFRALTLGGNASEWPAAQTLVAETVPEKRRGFFMGLVQPGYQVGFVIASGLAVVILPLAPLTVSWRYLFMIIALPAVIVAYLRYTVPESPRFVALDKLRNAFKAGDKAEVERIKKLYNVDEEKAVKFPLRQLFGKDSIRSAIVLPTYTFIKGWEFAFTAFIVLYLTQVKGFDSVTADTIVFFSLAMSVLGYLMTGFVGDYIGRREIALIDLSGAAVMSFVFVFVSGLTPVEEVLVYGLFAFFGFGVWSANMALYTECFPTRARGTGAGFASSMYWGGGIFWVALASVLSTFYGWQFCYIIIAPVANVLCPIVIACLKHIPPGKSLEELHI